MRSVDKIEFCVLLIGIAVFFTIGYFIFKHFGI